MIKKKSETKKTNRVVRAIREVKFTKDRTPANRNFEIFAWLLILAVVTLWCFNFGKAFLENESIINQLEKQISDQSVATEDTTQPADSSDVLGASTDNNGDVQGAEDNTVAQASPDDEVAQLVDDLEAERTQQLEDALQLQVPAETDDPSYELTFVEPTSSGVEIQVDGGGFTKQSSPYQLPALAIGKHVINFKFKDASDVSQNLEESIIVIPRPPQMATNQVSEFIAGGSYEFSGTALPKSTLIYIVSSGNVTSGQTEVDADGNWSLELTDLDNGDHSITCFVRKDGYASNFSETFLFSIKNAASTTLTVGDESSSSTNYIATVSKLISEGNPIVVAALGAISFLVIVIIAKIFGAIFSKKREENEITREATILRGDNREMSLREKFASVGLLDKSKEKSVETVEEDEAEEESEPEDTKPSKDKKTDENPKEPEVAVDATDAAEEEGHKVYSKDEFLKIFSKKEKSEKPQASNKLRITLTSKDPEK